MIVQWNIDNYDIQLQQTPTDVNLSIIRDDYIMAHCRLSSPDEINIDDWEQNLRKFKFYRLVELVEETNDEKTTTDGQPGDHRGIA